VWNRFPASGGVKAGIHSRRLHGASFKFTNGRTDAATSPTNEIHMNNLCFHAHQRSEGSGLDASQVGPETDHASA
jgi:hypothetical protein